MWEGIHVEVGNMEQLFYKDLNDFVIICCRYDNIRNNVRDKAKNTVLHIEKCAPKVQDCMKSIIEGAGG